MPCAHLCRTSFSKRFLDSISHLGLSPSDYELIKNRYVDIVTEAESNYTRTTTLFITLTNVITIGGVLLISFLPLEKVKIIPADAAEVFYWICWVISIIVTISHKSLFSFNIPRKYVLNTTFLEKYYSEGWQFAAGVNRYADSRDLDERVRLFLMRIEYIKLKSLEIMSNIENSHAERLQKNSNPPPFGTVGSSVALGSSDNLASDSVTLREVLCTAPSVPGAPEPLQSTPDRPASHIDIGSHDERS